MEKILSLSVSVGIFIFLLFLVTGHLNGEYYSGEYEFTVQDKKDEVWEILTNYNDFAKARNKVELIEVTGKFGGLVAWKENLEGGGYRKYRQIAKDDGQRLVIEMTESSYNTTGTWEFILTEYNDLTYVKIIENSKVTSPLKVGYMYYFGRNKETLEWVKLVKLRILGRLISTS
jgi:hypothetical protein